MERGQKRLREAAQQYVNVAEVYLAQFDASGRLQSGPTAITSRFAGANMVPAYSADGRFLDAANSTESTR